MSWGFAAAAAGDGEFGVQAAPTLGEAIRAEGDGLPEATGIFEDWLLAPAGR